MGKSYRNELLRLDETYAWGASTDVSQLAAAFARSVGRPLLVVGSGGSLTGAHVLASLHEAYSGALARATTPLDAIQSPDIFSQTDVILLSAGGRNPDVLIAFEALLAREPRSLTVITGRDGSPLGQRAGSMRAVNLVVQGTPVRDGYLATNSLLALAVCGARALQAAVGAANRLPDTLHSLLGAPTADHIANLSDLTRELWLRDSLLALYSHATSAAAIDIESKFIEAGIGSVHISDYRNFAHGRHQWLARFAPSTGVVAFHTPIETALVDSTLRLIPASVPRVQIELPVDPASAAVGSVATAIILAGVAAFARNIDPGRPHVPRFGRQLYHSKSLRTTVAREERSTRHAAAVRKARVAGAGATGAALIHEWETAFDEFSRALSACRFSGVILDYDGTLCDRRDRFRGVSAEVLDGLRGLTNAGIPVGIATGRGASVCRALREAIPPANWGGVLVGLYNGAVIQPLNSLERIDAGTTPSPDLTATAEAICADSVLARMVEVTVRPWQITAELRGPASELRAWDLITQIVLKTQSRPLTIVRSSHSVDVLAPGVSKRNLFARLRLANGLSPDDRLLCIGDRGRWPGNDCELLDEPHSLSVDEVSVAYDRCWNIAPAGMSGTQALEFYFRHFNMRDRRVEVLASAL